MRTPYARVLLLSAALAGGPGGPWRVVPAQADDVTWTGAASTSWNNTNNWQPARLPTAVDHAIIPTGTPDCTNTTGSTVDQLTVGGELTLRNGTFNLATTGRLYGVETTTDLRTGDWTLVPPEVQGTSGTLTFILTNDVPFRAYRTRVRVP